MRSVIVSSFAPDPDWENGRWNPVYRIYREHASAGDTAADKWVTTTEAIVATVKDRSVKRVVIRGRLSNAPSIRLSPASRSAARSPK
jgi:hypothetical protein